MTTLDALARTLDPVRGAHAQDYKAASSAARLPDCCVCASFLPDLWSTYYERFHGVLTEELNHLVRY